MLLRCCRACHLFRRVGTVRLSLTPVAPQTRSVTTPHRSRSTALHAWPSIGKRDIPFPLTRLSADTCSASLTSCPVFSLALPKLHIVARSFSSRQNDACHLSGGTKPSTGCRVESVPEESGGQSSVLGMQRRRGRTSASNIGRAQEIQWRTGTFEFVTPAKCRKTRWRLIIASRFLFLIHLMDMLTAGLSEPSALRFAGATPEESLRLARRTAKAAAAAPAVPALLQPRTRGESTPFREERGSASH